MIIKGDKQDFELTIGLEVHAQVSSNKKLFSNAPVLALAEQNTCVDFIDAGMPGMLPILNFYCIEQAVKTGLAINAEINKNSHFDRKHYFYPDLPQGYQITQFYEPIVKKGRIEITLEDGSKKQIRIIQIHLEQDAGKLMHDKKANKSFIDLNRAGVALMEIVSEPDIKSIYEAIEYVKTLRAILREVGSSDADMDKGNFRCDVNISISPLGSGVLGTRCEIKNLNSFKSITKAIEYEVQRQLEVIESGSKVVQQTRLFDQNTGETRALRDKEDADDYRYCPDPDILPVPLTDEFIENLKKQIPQLPNARAERYITSYGITFKEANTIAFDKDLHEFFEACLKICNEPKIVCSWLTTELLGRLNKLEIGILDCKVKASDLANLVARIVDNTISGKIAKDILDDMLAFGKNPDSIIEEKGLKQVTDEASIIAVARQVIDSNKDKVAEYKSGKDKLFGFFVGECMKLSKGKANPAVLNKILKDLL